MPNTPPLVLFVDVAHCRTKHEHKVTLITDGHDVYAHGDETDCGPALRDGTSITVTCNQPLSGDGQCDEPVEFNLTEDRWLSASSTAERGWAGHLSGARAWELLDRFGSPVELAD